nr:hypothetical protein [Tanacetum cinerariifolium]
MRRVGKGFSGDETPLFASMLVQPQPQAEEEVEVPLAPAPPSITSAPSPDQPNTPHESLMPLLTTLLETCATLPQKVVELEKDKHSQALEILQLKKKVKKLEKKKRSKALGLQKDKNGGKIAAINADEDVNLVYVEKDKEVVTIDVEPRGRLNQEEVNASSKGVRPIFKREYKKVQTLFKLDKDVEEPKKKRVADDTLLQESFKKLRAADVLGSESTQEIPSNDLKEMTKKDVQNIVGGIIEAYQVFKDMLKGFDREDLVALWNLVKEKFSLAMASVDKEKALWVELKRLFEPDADDVLWKLQRYMHAPLTWKLYTNYGVHHVSSTKRHDIFMLTEKYYPLSNVVMILMLSGKLQVKKTMRWQWI